MTVRLEKLTVKGQEALARAQTLASERGNPEITSLHLLSGLANEDDGIVAEDLSAMGHVGGGEPHVAGADLARFLSYGQAHPALNDEAHLFIGVGMHRVGAAGVEFDPTEFLMGSHGEPVFPPDLHVGEVF